MLLEFVWTSWCSLTVPYTARLHSTLWSWALRSSTQGYLIHVSRLEEILPSSQSPSRLEFIRHCGFLKKKLKSICLDRHLDSMLYCMFLICLLGLLILSVSSGVFVCSWFDYMFLFIYLFNYFNIKHFVTAVPEWFYRNKLYFLNVLLLLNEKHKVGNQNFFAKDNNNNNNNNNKDSWCSKDEANGGWDLAGAVKLQNVKPKQCTE